MTPKEKAQELLLRFSKTHIICVSNTKGKLISPYSSGYASIIVRNDRAKKCALIAVDEMLKVTPKYSTDELLTPKGSTEVRIPNCTYEYLEQVKQEIEAL